MDVLELNPLYHNDKIFPFMVNCFTAHMVTHTPAHANFGICLHLAIGIRDLLHHISLGTAVQVLVIWAFNGHCLSSKVSMVVSL